MTNHNTLLIGMENLLSQIDYQFRNPQLLEQALTHPSLKHGKKNPSQDNQRLEFLGDAVIQLAVSEFLFHRVPDGKEGRLSKTRALIVSEPALAKSASSISLGESLHLGKSEIASNGRQRPSILADGFEALIGAIFLDSDFETAKQIALRICHPQIETALEAPESMNPKGALQEITQAAGNESPDYAIILEKGPDHARHFVAEVSWKGKKLATGSGNTKQAAQADAARSALQHPSILTLCSEKNIECEKLCE